MEDGVVESGGGGLAEDGDGGFCGGELEGEGDGVGGGVDGEDVLAGRGVWVGMGDAEAAEEDAGVADFVVHGVVAFEVFEGGGPPEVFGGEDGEVAVDFGDKLFEVVPERVFGKAPAAGSIGIGVEEEAGGALGGGEVDHAAEFVASGRAEGNFGIEEFGKGGPIEGLEDGVVRTGVTPEVGEFDFFAELGDGGPWDRVKIDGKEVGEVAIMGGCGAAHEDKEGGFACDFLESAAGVGNLRGRDALEVRFIDQVPGPESGV